MLQLIVSDFVLKNVYSRWFFFSVCYSLEFLVEFAKNKDEKNVQFPWLYEQLWVNMWFQRIEIIFIVIESDGISQIVEHIKAAKSFEFHWHSTMKVKHMKVLWIKFY